jgi:hypothetical protein
MKITEFPVSEASGSGASKRKPVGVYKHGEVRPEPAPDVFGPVEDDDEA